MSTCLAIPTAVMTNVGATGSAVPSGCTNTLYKLSLPLTNGAWQELLSCLQARGAHGCQRSALGGCTGWRWAVAGRDRTFPLEQRCAKPADLPPSGVSSAPNPVQYRQGWILAPQDGSGSSRGQPQIAGMRSNTSNSNLDPSLRSDIPIVTSPAFITSIFSCLIRMQLFREGEDDDRPG